MRFEVFRIVSSLRFRERASESNQPGEITSFVNSAQQLSSVLTNLFPRFRLLGYMERLFPIWALKRQVHSVYRAFDADLAKAKASKNSGESESLEEQRHWEATEYEDKILSLKSRRLMAAAETLYLYIPDLLWEQGNYGDRYLDRASLSKPYHAVKEQRDKNREYRLKLAGAVTGIIGAMIGLVAVWKR
jgi:hypothetical protein